MAASSSKRAVVGVVLIAWLLEWLFSWSSYLGRIGEGIQLIWLIALGYLVVRTRSGRIPRAVHLWGWMLVLLAVTAVQAWWLGSASLGLFATLAERFPDVRSELSRHDISVIDAVVTASIIGLVLGLLGAINAIVIGVSTWIGGRLRADAVPARVGLIPRIVVVVLQTPIFVALIAAGLAAVAGAAGMYERGGDASTYAPAIVGFGVCGWALAVVHFDRLGALSNGALATRILLAVIGIAAAAALVELADGSIRTIAAAVVWLIAQLAALRWARPVPVAAPSSKPLRRG